MTRRNLLKSLLNSVLSAPFLPLVLREKAEDHIAGADKMVEPKKPFPQIDHQAIADRFVAKPSTEPVKGYLIRCEDNAILHFPAIVEPGKQYIAVAENVGTGMAFKPSRAGTITNILGHNP